MKPALLTIEQLTIGYPDLHGSLRPVLRDISLQIAEGERLGIVGESGCGKSTLALALLGFLRRGAQVAGGVIRYAGQDLFGLPAAARQRLRGQAIALVPQNAGQALTPNMTIGAQVAEVLQIHRRMPAALARQATEQLLAQVRLPDPPRLVDRYPHQLSGGQQQRVAIAMALAGEPKLLVLDEPTTGLDVTTQAHLLDLLDELGNRTGAAMVYVSHDLGVIARASQRMVVMYAGELVEDGPTAAIFAQQRHPYTQGLLASVPRLHIAALPTAMDGQPPAPADVRHGCAFAPRCQLADTECHTLAPLLAPIAPDQSVRCHHWRQLQPKVPPATSRHPKEPGGDQLLLQVEDVSISYTRQGVAAWVARRLGQAPTPAAVRSVGFHVLRGQTLALVGESGSGKSTIARTIAGLHPALHGQIRFDQQPLAAHVQQRSIELRRRIQLIFQNPDASLNPRQTIEQILWRPQQLFFGRHRRDARQHSAQVLEQMRIPASYLAHVPSQLSGGEKQRIAIARAFLAEPDLILCDEVVSALDVSVQAAVLALLADLQAQRQVSYLFISHDLAVVRALADQVAVLYQGQLCEIGPATAIFAPPYHPYTESLLAAVPQPDPAHRYQAIDREPLLPTTGTSMPPACPFYQRCPRRIEPLCAEKEPPWQQATHGHALRCHRPITELSIPLVSGSSPTPTSATLVH